MIRRGQEKSERVPCQLTSSTEVMGVIRPLMWFNKRIIVCDTELEYMAGSAFAYGVTQYC